MLQLLLSLALAGTLPTLVEAPEGDYPVEELTRGRASQVLLALSIDDTGRVNQVTVLQSGGPAFDAAAVRAATNFVFSPGTTDDGQPADATVQYLYRFEAREAEPVSVRGIVRQAGTRAPLGGASISLVRAEQRVTIQTSDEGTFELGGLASGVWDVVLGAQGYEALETQVELVDDEPVELSVSLVETRPWEAERVDLEVVVVGKRLAPDITERRITDEQIRYLPGTGGDVVKVIQNLPGVARPPLGIGQLLVRGTAPEDSAYNLDGAAVPSVFHFSGLSTVVPGDLIQEVGFLPGNYGVRYGRTIGGHVDLRTNSKLPDRSNGSLSVDVFQTSLWVQQIVGERHALSVSGRRSYVDAILNPVLNNAGSASVQVPRYYDAQARWLTQTNRGHVDMLLLTSDDRFRVVGQDADDNDQTQIGLTTWFHKLRLRSVEDVGRGWQHEASLTGGPENQSFETQDGEAFERPMRLAFREEISRTVTEPVGGQLGLDVQGGRWNYVYDVNDFGEREAADVPYVMPAAYGELTLRSGPVTWIGGVRGDVAAYGSDYFSGAVDPRAAIRIGEQPTLIKLSMGQFSQFPVVRQALERPALSPQRSLQTALGWEQQWSPIWDTEFTLYVNQLANVVVGREDVFRFFSGPPDFGPMDTAPYANDGIGSIYGAEAQVRLTADQTMGWLAATVSRSARTNRSGDDAALFDYDQPIVLTAVASHQLAKRWRLGGRARFGSGNPYTPVVNRVFDLQSREYLPVFGERDSMRLPPFWSLDLRADKGWVYDNWIFSVYLDLQNATNTANVELMTYTFDYAEQDPVTSIPIVPAFGLKGEW